jgi:hypothetical protein
MNKKRLEQESFNRPAATYAPTELTHRYPANKHDYPRVGFVNGYCIVPLLDGILL